MSAAPFLGLLVPFDGEGLLPLERGWQVGHIAFGKTSDAVCCVFLLSFRHHSTKAFFKLTGGGVSRCLRALWHSSQTDNSSS